MRLPLLKPSSREKQNHTVHGILLLLLVGLLFFVTSVVWEETASANGNDSLQEVPVGPEICKWDEIAEQWTWTKDQLQPCSGISPPEFDKYFQLADADPNQWLSVYEIAMTCPIPMEAEDKTTASKSGSARKLLSSRERRSSVTDFMPPSELLEISETPRLDPEFIDHFCRPELRGMFGYSYAIPKALEDMSKEELAYLDRMTEDFGEMPSVNRGQVPMSFDPTPPQVVATLGGLPACDSRKVHTTRTCAPGALDRSPCLGYLGLSPAIPNAECMKNQNLVLACECKSGFIFNNERKAPACIPCTVFTKPAHQCSILLYSSVCNDQWQCVWHEGQKKCIEFTATADVRAAIDSSTDTKVPGETLTHQNINRWVAQGVFDHSDLDAYAFCGGGSAANTKWMGAFWGIFNGMKSFGNLQEYLRNKVVGTNSGGGWFFTDLVYEASASALFAPTATIADLENWIDIKIKSHYKVLYENQKWTWKTRPKPFQNDYDALDKAFGGAPHGWERYIDAIHESYGAAATPQWDISGVDWYSITLMLTRGPFMVDAETNVKTEIDLKQLGSTREWGGGTIIPVYLHYNPRAAYNLEHLVPNDGVQIPWVDSAVGDGLGPNAAKHLLKMTIGGAEQMIPVAAVKQGIVESVQDPKIKSGPSSNAPGMMMAGASHAAIGAGQLMTLRNFGWKATFPDGSGLDGLGTVLVDGGALDNPGLASAIRGLQKNGGTKNGPVKKIIVFLSGLHGNIKLYFGANPFGGGKPMPSPFPHIFDKWIQLGPWRVDRGVGNLSIIPVLVRTKDNLEWGIEGKHYYRVVFVNVGPDLEALPQMAQKGRSRVTDFVDNSVRAANAFSALFP